jgi:hypothetical protein
MLEAIVSQQVEYGVPTASSRRPIQQDFESTSALQPDFHLYTAQFPINKCNHVSSENSMFRSGMGFLSFLSRRW